MTSTTARAFRDARVHLARLEAQRKAAGREHLFGRHLAPAGRARAARALDQVGLGARRHQLVDRPRFGRIGLHALFDAVDALQSSRTAPSGVRSAACARRRRARKSTKQQTRPPTSVAYRHGLHRIVGPRQARQGTIRFVKHSAGQPRVGRAEDDSPSRPLRTPSRGVPRLARRCASSRARTG